MDFGFQISDFGFHTRGRAMRPEFYFTQVGQGVLAAVSTRTFHVGASASRFCLAQRSSASGSSPLGGGGDVTLLAYCSPSKVKALIN